MKSGLEKREEPDRLVFQVKQARRLGNLLWTIVALIAFYLFWRVLPSRTERVPVACVILLLLARQIFVTWRGTHVELHVTNLDLVSKGRSPGGYRSITISRADIYDLEYRAAQPGGGEVEDLPEGLYAVYKQLMPWDASHCMLPEVGRRQAEEIIQEIMHRFPDTGALASRPSTPSELTSLNLNMPTDR
jgi:hypothetical protein